METVLEDADDISQDFESEPKFVARIPPPRLRRKSLNN